MKTIISSAALRHNFRELIFVFLAFAMLVVAANISIGRILRIRLLDRTEEIMYTADANVRAGLSAADTILLNSYHIIIGMLEREAPKQEILDYLITTTDWMQQQDQGLLGFNGIYAFINGEFYDSVGLNPDSNFVPQSRPWYQLAIRSGQSIAYTSPFASWHTEDLIFSAVRNLSVNGVMVGILSVDIDIRWLVNYISSLSPAAVGYGMLLSENMVIMAHPDNKLISEMLQVSGGSYIDIARTLRAGGSVYAQRIKDTDGSSAIAFFNPISNDWFIGLVIPHFEFYRDLYITSLILIALGLVLSLALSYILMRLSAEKMKAAEESKSKSTFLASMSHEIRTPMNAITGMSELALREEMSDTVREHILTIKQAGANLLSIINDILDFSKVEAGLLEIVQVNYTLSSLVNDVVNIIRNRLGEKPIRFYANIDSKIPNNLIGDVVRMRQIFLNLLSNAVKYTEKGHICLSITRYQPDSGSEGTDLIQAWFKISVSDTGFGIKDEDQAKLFGDFVQLDSAKNRGIEGTGLGLSITKRLCVAMGGDITMESEYGKGSTFTVIIPQGIESELPFAEVENAKDKNVLIYEGRLAYTNSLCWSLENMGVPYTQVRSADELAEALKNQDWFFVISGYGLYDQIKHVMENIEYPGGKQPPLLALMVGQEIDICIPNVYFVQMPVHSLTIANILNGKTEKNVYIDNPDLTFSFTIPSCRLLVVDDTATNIKVAEGFLASYKATVDTCLSGKEAIELVKQRASQKEDYDMIFMDHMMPEMDGIETTTLIRAWEQERDEDAMGFAEGETHSLPVAGRNVRKPIPIIALTANAVLGMREMFLEKGFNDFLAKPIDVSKLNEILERWIPEEKREEKREKIEENREIINMELLKVFKRDAEKAVVVLQETLANGNIKLFTTTVHAMKSALANIGESGKSEAASMLENAALNGDVEFITYNADSFIESLQVLVQSLIPDEGANDVNIPDSFQEDMVYLAEQLEIIKSACEDYDDEAANSALDRLKEKPWRSETLAAIKEIGDMLFLHSDFDGAVEQVKTLLEIYQGEIKI